MTRALRLLRILWTVYRFGLDEIALASLRSHGLRRVVRFLALGRDLAAPRGRRLRLALEDLGPIFVKFGQVLSTRRDLLPQDVADELALLQDRVPPFDPALAAREIERGLGRRIDAVFSHFEAAPVASASIAQVHFAVMRDEPAMGAWAGREVAVKVLRPNMLPAIDNDLGLLEVAASLVERLWSDGKRLRPREVVREFDTVLRDELDLMREAANAAQLRRNFMPELHHDPSRPVLRVPEMNWDYCRENVLVMERMVGVPVSQIERIRAAGIDIRALSAEAVRLFFTQALRDGFFHADMHPGNIFVGIDPARPRDFGRWIALDFGIVGTLSEDDRQTLANIFLAFFRRDYKRVAQLYIESGWVKASTRPEALEAAIRTISEPIFDRPLKDISFGQILLRLFAAARRFDLDVQPQLVLLQKTLLNIEGLGRQLDPDLDLWKTAKPFLERWMDTQVGFKSLEEALKREAPQWAQLVPQLPRLLHSALVEGPERQAALQAEVARLRAELARRNRLLLIGVTCIAAFVIMVAWTFIGMPLPGR